MKIVCQLDDDGYFVGTTVADESPLEPGTYHIPRAAVDASLPEIPENHKAKWNNGWIYEPIPGPEPEPEPPNPYEGWTYADYRRAEYPPVADYLDGIVKGDQEQIDKYIADCLTVKAKYPKPTT